MGHRGHLSYSIIARWHDVALDYCDYEFTNQQLKRAELERRPGFIDDILESGTTRGRAEAQKTLHQVREAMRLDYFGS